MTDTILGTSTKYLVFVVLYAHIGFSVAAYAMMKNQVFEHSTQIASVFTVFVPFVFTVGIIIYNINSKYNEDNTDPNTMRM